VPSQFVELLVDVHRWSLPVVLADEEDVGDLRRFEAHDDPELASQVHYAQMIKEIAAEPVGESCASPGG
jgi:hypothetical protein